MIDAKLSNVSGSQNVILEQAMSFEHTVVDLSTDRAICFGISGAVAELDNQVDWILLQFLQVLEVIIQDYFLRTFAVRMLALLDMCFHLFNKFASLSLQDLDVFILLLHRLPPPDFVFYFLQGIRVDVFEFNFHFLFLAFVPLLYLVDFVLVRCLFEHYSFLNNICYYRNQLNSLFISTHQIFYPFKLFRSLQRLMLPVVSQVQTLAQFLVFVHCFVGFMIVAEKSLLCSCQTRP